MITIIAGTNRKDSVSLKVAQELANIYLAAGIEHELIDLRELPPELYLPESYKEKPEAFAAYADKVLQADGLHIVVPEYNGSYPGILKVFIDMLPFPEAFEDRPAAFVGISAGASGGVRPVEHLQQVFAYRNSHLYPRRVFIPAVYKAIGESGHLADPELQGRLEKQATGFADFCRRVK